MELVNLVNVFMFLAQPHEELVLYFPDYELNSLYRRVDDDGFYEDIQIPSKAAGLTCITVIHDLFAEVKNKELISLMGEAMSLLTMMLDLPSHSEYLWMVNKDRSLIRGPYDTSWAILRRLATCWLSGFDANIRPSKLPFAEFIKLGGFSRWNIIPSSED